MTLLENTHPRFGKPVQPCFWEGVFPESRILANTGKSWQILANPGKSNKSVPGALRVVSDCWDTFLACFVDGKTIFPLK